MSYEPALGAVALGSWLKPTLRTNSGERVQHPDPRAVTDGGRWEWGINWVVCGGESGPNARPMHPNWARSMRDQCEEAGVPCLFKQWGAWVGGTGSKSGFISLQNGASGCGDKNTHEWGDGVISQRVGKKKAGRLLDGKLHDEFPRGAK